MNRGNRWQNGLEEQLLIMIYKLIDKKTSRIFRQPVDAVKVPDYYEKIKKPIDIATMINKLKTNKYTLAEEIREDFDLMMVNCRKFNSNLQILRMAEKFEKSIETEWGNFQKECQKREISLDTQLEVNEDTLKKFEGIEDKYTNRKPSNLQAVLSELEGGGRRQAQQYSVLPPIPNQLLAGDKAEELPPHLTYHPLKYASLSQSDKIAKLRFSVEKQEIAGKFEEASVKKLAKYKKILRQKVMWIENKIIKKCLERKRYRKMATPQYLSSYIENGQIASELQLRKLQLYVKMVAYWVEEYPTTLSYYMKNKFVDTCRAIKRAIFRVLRYKKMPRATKIHLDLQEGEQKEKMEAEQRQELNEDETRKYDNEVKSFKRMLSKDQGETIKKHTKIQIRNENGQFTVVDWNLESVAPKKQRTAAISQAPEHTEQSRRYERERMKKEERDRDEQFLAQFQSKTTGELMKTYNDSLFFDWDGVFNKIIQKENHELTVDFSKLLF